MLVMTEAAGGYLSEMLKQAKVPDETAVRVVIEGDALKTKLDTTRPGDDTFDHNGKKVLLLDSKVSEVLADSKLDIQSTAEGSALVLVN